MFEAPVVKILADIDSKELNPYEDNLGIKIGSSQYINKNKNNKSCCN